MNNRNLLSLVAMTFIVGTASAQSAGPEQSGNAQTPIAGSPDPQVTDMQPAETRTEWAIRPEENPGTATSPYPESADPALYPVRAAARELSGDSPSAITTDGNIRYMSGGVGESERAELDAMASQFNLHLMFATAGSGEYLSSVQVNIMDSGGGPVLTTVSKGPLFFAQLPAGNYSVEVTPTGLRGQDLTQQKAVQLSGSGQSRLDFYWKR